MNDQNRDYFEGITEQMVAAQPTTPKAMTIIELMQKEIVRVSVGDRWIIREDNGTFTVYSREYGQKYTRTLATGVSEEDAVAAVLAE